MKRVIVFATAYFPLVGGAEIALKEITDRLPDWQIDLVCARIKPGLASTEKIGSITVHRVGFGSTIDKFLLPLLGTWRALRLDGSRGAPVWSLMASFGGFTALTYCWIRPKTKMLLTLQEGDPLEHYKKRAGAFQFLHEMIFRRATSVQAISNFLATWATEMGFPRKPTVIPNGVDVARFAHRITSQQRAELRRQFGFAESDTVLVTASRLSLKNGVDDLIRSLSSLPANVKTLIIGDGEDREMLKALTTSLQLEGRVVFAGQRGHDELPMLLQASDMFIRASLSEGLGNSFLEAMASGVPIIGTRVGGIPDFLTDGTTGVFCMTRDPESIAAAVLRIQKNEMGLRERIIDNAYHLATEIYNWDGIAVRMNELLTSLL
ncbi:MAG: glycosyltransferase family 4 protein [Patescibacteria group bacterium]